MPFAETRDRSAIAARLRRNPRAHAYELGDLDDFDWPFTRWFGWHAEGVLEEVVLLYTQPAVPVLLAIADDPDGPMALLLEAIRDELPARIYVHVTPPLLDVLAARYAIDEAHGHLKLALARSDRLGDQHAEAGVLASDDLDEITVLYDRAYPGTWFEPRLLATGRYVGIRLEGRLACVAGVHVYTRLGFEQVAGYTEAALVARG